MSPPTPALSPSADVNSTPNFPVHTSSAGDNVDETSALLLGAASTSAGERKSLSTRNVAMAVLNRVKTILWGPESAEDRSLVIKLDLTLLPYFSLIWFLFGINRASCKMPLPASRSCCVFQRRAPD